MVYERKTLIIPVDDVTEMMKVIVDDDSLVWEAESPIDFDVYSHDADVDYDYEELRERLSTYLNVHIDVMFCDTAFLYCICMD